MREANYAKEFAISKRAKGVAILMGHLLLAGVLKPGVAFEASFVLLKRKTDLSVDCLSELLSVVGPYIRERAETATEGEKVRYCSNKFL